MNLTQENINRLRQLIQDGARILEECDDLKGSLNDTIKAVAEEMDVKSSILNKFIKERYKGKTNDVREESEILEELRKAAD